MISSIKSSITPISLSEFLQSEGHCESSRSNRPRDHHDVSALSNFYITVPVPLIIQ
jgi:hypothetical protein